MPSATFTHNSYVCYRVWETQTGSGSPQTKCSAQTASASSRDHHRDNLKLREEGQFSWERSKDFVQLLAGGPVSDRAKVAAEVLASLWNTFSYRPGKGDIYQSWSKYWTKSFQIKKNFKTNTNLYAQPLLFGLINSVGFALGFFNVIPRNYPKYSVYQQSHFRFCAHKISSAKHLVENKSPVNLRAQKYNQPPFSSASKLFF